MRYEGQVHEYLALLALGVHKIEYREGPWIEFYDKSGRRFCQLDALMVNRTDRVCIIYEIKYQHCLEAWFQLRELYYPVVKAIFPGYAIGLMEICQWHDPQVRFPQAYSFADSPLRVPKANEVAVFIFNAKRRGRLPRVLEAGNSGSESCREEVGGIADA